MSKESPTQAKGAASAAWSVLAGQGYAQTTTPGTVEELVVTARRVEERLQDVPSSAARTGAETVSCQATANKARMAMTTTRRKLRTPRDIVRYPFYSPNWHIRSRRRRGHRSPAGPV